MRFGAALVGTLTTDLGRPMPPTPPRVKARPPSKQLRRLSKASSWPALKAKSLERLGKEARASLSGEAVRWGASSCCLDVTLREVIDQVAAIFGPVRVNSTCRSRSRNAKVGGAPHSKHLSGDAADFSVSRNNKPAV